MLLPPESQRMNYWDKLYDAKDLNKTITARVTAVVSSETLNTRNWKLEFNEYDILPTHIYGTVPYSETGLTDEELMNYFIDKTIKVKIKGIDKKEGIIACTRREVVEESLSHIIHIVKVGQEIETVISYITNTRIGLDIGGGVIMDINRKKAATSKSVPLGAMYTEGMIIKAIVEKVDKDKKDIDISISDPWQGLNYPRGTIISCPVVHIGEENIFVSAIPGVVGITSMRVNGNQPELGERLILQVNVYDPIEKTLKLKEYNPEKIRGRKNNRAYWKRIKEEKEEQNQGKNDQTIQNQSNTTETIMRYDTNALQP